MKKQKFDPENIYSQYSGSKELLDRFALAREGEKATKSNYINDFNNFKNNAGAIEFYPYKSSHPIYANALSKSVINTKLQPSLGHTEKLLTEDVLNSLPDNYYEGEVGVYRPNSQHPNNKLASLQYMLNHAKDFGNLFNAKKSHLNIFSERPSCFGLTGKNCSTFLNEISTPNSNFGYIMDYDDSIPFYEIPKNHDDNQFVQTKNAYNKLYSAYKNQQKLSLADLMTQKQQIQPLQNLLKQINASYSSNQQKAMSPGLRNKLEEQQKFDYDQSHQSYNTSQNQDSDSGSYFEKKKYQEYNPLTNALASKEIERLYLAQQEEQRIREKMHLYELEKQQKKEMLIKEKQQEKEKLIKANQQKELDYRKGVKEQKLDYFFKPIPPQTNFGTGNFLQNLNQFSRFGTEQQNYQNLNNFDNSSPIRNNSDKFLQNQQSPYYSLRNKSQSPNKQASSFRNVNSDVDMQDEEQYTSETMPNQNTFYQQLNQQQDDHLQNYQSLPWYQQNTQSQSYTPYTQFNFDNQQYKMAPLWSKKQNPQNSLQYQHPSSNIGVYDDNQMMMPGLNQNVFETSQQNQFQQSPYQSSLQNMGRSNQNNDYQQQHKARGGRVTRPRYQQSNFNMKRAMQILELLSRGMA